MYIYLLNKLHYSPRQLVMYMVSNQKRTMLVKQNKLPTVNSSCIHYTEVTQNAFL